MSFFLQKIENPESRYEIDDFGNMTSRAARVIHMISGTAKTGKDTLHLLLKTGFIHFVEYPKPRFGCGRHSPNTARMIAILWAMYWILIQFVSSMVGKSNDVNVCWYVFGTKNSMMRARDVGLFTKQNRRRYAFADALKQFCNNQMRYADPICASQDNEWFEKNKDSKVITYDGKLVTPREIYIPLGTARRQNDPDIWARKCFDTLDHSPHNNDDPAIFDITNYRFRNERKYAVDCGYTVFTSRLYRGIKASDDPSEHDLDNTVANFLMVRSTWDYIKYVFASPDYAHYGLIGEMHMLPK